MSFSETIPVAIYRFHCIDLRGNISIKIKQESFQPNKLVYPEILVKFESPKFPYDLSVALIFVDKWVSEFYGLIFQPKTNLGIRKEK